MAKNTLNDNDRCLYVASDGRRCSLPRAEGHDSFCMDHWRKEENLAAQHDPEADALVAQILGGRSDFRTATDINRALGHLFSLVARKKINRRTAVILTYMVQLMLQTLHGVHDEFIDLRNNGEWKAVLEEAIHASSELPATKLASARARQEGQQG